MSRLPSVRLGSSQEGPPFHDIDVDLQSSSGSKFGFAWPDGSPEVHKRGNLLLRNDPHYEWHSIDPASEEADATPSNDLIEDGTPVSDPTSIAAASTYYLAPQAPPRISRAFSMPLPSQLGHLQHPSRSSSGTGSPVIPALKGPAATGQYPQDLALELADSVQMVIQTLLQLSPPHLFDPAKELYSACAVQIPTPCISALLTSMKNLNYISANMQRFGSPADEGGSHSEPQQEAVKDEFDIAELLQSVGDSLGGVAAEAGVDLVLHHGYTFGHMSVRGDECGISYTLSHAIHQVLITAQPGDSIEIGLSITSQPFVGDALDRSSAVRPSEFAPLNAEGPVVCMFEIAHKFTSSHVDAPSPNDPNGEPPPVKHEPQAFNSEMRPEPQLDTTILRRLLKHICGTLRQTLILKSFRNGRRYELAVTLERGPPLSEMYQRNCPAEEEISHHNFPNVRLACEPSLEELTSFAGTLRGKKVAFHASSQGSFAHHLTRYLTAWGMDISHVPTDGVEEKDPAENTPQVHIQTSHGSSASLPRPPIGLRGGDNVPPVIDSASDVPPDSRPTSIDPCLSFIIIDDDVMVLRRRLLQYRAEAAPNLQLRPRKRPSLATIHRPRSSPSIRNALLAGGAQQQPSPPTAFSPVPIIHFTSLANYKLVKDAIQAVLLAPSATPVLPEVIVIPKPAGPRRFLTALHTTIVKPVVDSFFSPIATSPMSPGGAISPFVMGRKSAGASTPPSASRSTTDRHSRTNSDSVSSLPSTSPLAIPEGLEYFPDTAVKKLGGNAASGLVIQNPDGRPAGIFFQPQSRSSLSRPDISTTMMERERGLLRPGAHRSSKRSSGRNTNTNSRENTGPNDAPKNKELTPGSPTPKSSFLLPLDKPVPLSPASSCLERPRLSDQTELIRSYKGKGRAPTTLPESEQSCGLSSEAWIEATQNLTKLPSTTLAPLLDLNPGSTTDVPATQSPMTDPASTLQGRKANHPGFPPTPCRAPSAPTSPDVKKSVARRVTHVSKGPNSPGLKKSKTMGNNIVPPISVLIVEDNAINQTILSTFMRRNKIKYEVAWNGREAVEKWRSGNFHLILMDIQMPVMDGIEATKEIRRLEKAESMSHFPLSPAERSTRSTETPDSKPSSAASTPFRSQVIIVALTASSLQSDRVAALAAGCNDFLTKPVTNSWLNDKIIEWGSIKALQMWAELRPEMARNISLDQNAQAQAVAKNLHVPPPSARGSPFSSSSLPTAERITNHPRATRVDSDRRSSEKGSSSSDSSPERWPLSSDDEATQDPITEPPAVISTPVRLTVELPEPVPEPKVAIGGEALLNGLEESRHDSRQDILPHPTSSGQQVMGSVKTATSIASGMHETPGVDGASTDGLAVADTSETVRDATAQNTSERKVDAPGH